MTRAYLKDIIVDEAHHNKARTYEAVLKKLTSRIFMIGLSATPYRTRQDEDVLEIFERLNPSDYRKYKYTNPHTGKQVPYLYEYTLIDALDDGILPQIDYILTTTQRVEPEIWQTVLEETKANRRPSMELLDQVLFKKASPKDIVKIFTQKVEEYQRQYESWKPKAIIFAACIEDAEKIVQEFQARTDLIYRVGCYHSGNTLYPKSMKDTRERFKLDTGDSHAIDIIVVFNKFNEGIDVPECNMIMLARKTTSPVIYFQQLGRGLRRKEKGMNSVLVVDILCDIMHYFLTRSFRQAIMGISKGEGNGAGGGRKGSVKEELEGLEYFLQQLPNYKEFMRGIDQEEEFELLNRHLNRLGNSAENSVKSVDPKIISIFNQLPSDKIYGDHSEDPEFLLQVAPIVVQNFTESFAIFGSPSKSKPTSVSPTSKSNAHSTSSAVHDPSPMLRYNSARLFLRFLTVSIWESLGIIEEQFGEEGFEKQLSNSTTQEEVVHAVVKTAIAQCEAIYSSDTLLIKENQEYHPYTHELKEARSHFPKLELCLKYFGILSSCNFRLLLNSEKLIKFAQSICTLFGDSPVQTTKQKPLWNSSGFIWDPCCGCGVLLFEELLTVLTISPPENSSSLQKVCSHVWASDRSPLNCLVTEFLLLLAITPTLANLQQQGKPVKGLDMFSIFCGGLNLFRQESDSPVASVVPPGMKKLLPKDKQQIGEIGPSFIQCKPRASSVEERSTVFSELFNIPWKKYFIVEAELYGYYLLLALEKLAYDGTLYFVLPKLFFSATYTLYIEALVTQCSLIKIHLVCDDLLSVKAIKKNYMDRTCKLQMRNMEELDVSPLDVANINRLVMLNFP